MKAEQFAEEMKRRNGYDSALKIADSRMKGTSPTMWHLLPVSNVFGKKDKKGNFKGLDEKHLRNLHNFWQHVYYVLLKMNTKKK